MNTSEKIRQDVSNEEIGRRAYELWEQDGRPYDKSEQHWLEAERQLNGAPTDVGNPAYPSLVEREKILDNHIGKGIS